MGGHDGSDGSAEVTAAEAGVPLHILRHLCTASETHPIVRGITDNKRETNQRRETPAATKQIKKTLAAKET